MGLHGDGACSSCLCMMQIGARGMVLVVGTCSDLHTDSPGFSFEKLRHSFTHTSTPLKRAHGTNTVLTF